MGTGLPMHEIVQSRKEVFERLKSAETAIRALGVRRLALFGSFVRETASLESDVDVLVEFEPERKTYDRFLDLSELLERLLGRRVEIVTTESLSPYLGAYILSEARDVIRAA